MEQLERDSTNVEVDPSDLQKLAGMMDEQGNLPPHSEGQPEPEAEPQPEKTAEESKPVEETVPQGETAEIDYDGAKYTVPAKLKDAFLRQADYTRKTQEVAQARAAVDQERQAVARLAQEAQVFVGQYAAIQQIDQKIAEFQKVDWQKLATEDPWQNLQMRQSWTELVQARQLAQQGLEQARVQAQQKQMAAMQQAIQAGHELLSKDIPNWGAEMQKALMDVAQSVGYREDELANIADPRAVKLLHKAYLYDQSQKEQRVAEKQVRQVPPKVVRPTASSGPAPERNEALIRLRKTGSDTDALAALKHLGLD